MPAYGVAIIARMSPGTVLIDTLAEKVSERTVPGVG